MTWSLFDLFRRRFTKKTRPSPIQRQTPKRRVQPWLELLEDRLVPSTYTVQSSFNATAVPAGDTLWYNSSINNVQGVGSSPVKITVTNQTITFTDSTAGTFNLTLPDAVITLNPSGGTATTTFDTVNNQWVSSDPTGLGGNLFLSGYESRLAASLHGSDNPVKWTANFTCDTAGVTFNWAWAAAAYSSFSTTYSSLGVKPCDDSSASSYFNSDKAGTPESYRTKDVGGAKGGGGANHTGNFTSSAAITPTYIITAVTLAGNVYNDANNNGVDDGSDTGVSGVTLTLTGTTTGGQSVNVTTTSAADGTYSFTTDQNGNTLVAGTYQIAETQPAGYYQGSNNVGTVSGTANGSLVPVNTIGTITLTAGQNGINYNFGNVNPFTQVTPAYPYSSGTANTNVAFNESEIMTGASVNVANGALNMWYSDEHALNLGVSAVTVISSSGRSTTTNYTVSSMGAADPATTTSPAVGDTATTGDQAAVDTSGRPLFPSLYITDITANSSSTSGDWQNGGTAVAPNAVYGSWKAYTISVDHRSSPATVTETAGADPASGNDWTQLGSGADTPPAGLTNYGYCTDVQWNLSSLYSQGYLVSGHNYRFYFIIHDGDQIHPGGDAGQAAYTFTYRGPVSISGNVYKDVYGNGVDGAGDSGIGGVALSLTGTTNTGKSITVTTTTAADGTYSFTKDSTGTLLTGGTYQVAETQPAGYLQGYNTVGLTDWSSGFQTAWTNTTTSGTGPGFTHDGVTSATDSVFTGAGSLDTNSITKWLKTTGQPAATDDIADAFATNFNDSLTGHNFILAGLDRYSSTAATTAGFWAFQNSISVNANGTFSGVHTNGDLLFIVSVTQNGAASVNVYEWTGTDATGTLTLITPATGATYVNVNTTPTTVPWAFTDTAGNTKPQAGELLQVGVDLNAVFGLTVPHFASFLAATRASTSTGATLLDFATSTMNTVAGSFTADGTLIPTDKIGSIVASDGQNGINYNFGEVQPVTVAGKVYQDSNGNGLLDSGEPGLAGVTVSLTGTTNLGQAVSATTTTAANGTYSFTVDSTGKLLPPGTYQLVETVPATYLASAANVGTDNGTTDGAAVSATTLGSIVLHTGDNGLNYNFGDYQPVSVAGAVYQDTNGNNLRDTGELGLAGVTVTLTGTTNAGQSVNVTTTTAADGTYSFTKDASGNLLVPGAYVLTETVPTGYVTGAANVGTVNGTADGNAASASQINNIALTSGQSGINYLFGDLKAVTLAGLVYQDTNGNNALDAGEPGLASVTLTLTGTNNRGQSITATTTTAADGTYSLTTDSSGNGLRPGTYVITETVPTGYVSGAAAVGTVNGTADGTAASATQLSTIALTSGQSGSNYNFGDLKAVTLAGLVYQDSNGNNALNAGEPGIAGVTLTLSGTNGLGQSVSATTTTAANGTYSFTTDSSGNGLRPGTYAITETAPSGYLTGAAAVGTVNGSADGTAASATQLSTIALSSGQNGINYNFGDVKAVTLAGLVYQDSNGNNALDAGEPGLAGVTLTLTGTNGLGQAITATATTAANGTYSFTTDSSGNVLRPGTYVITETAPAGYLTGAATVGTVNGSADGTVASATQLSTIALTSGQSGINYNFGDLKAVTLAGLVYQDSNGNNALNSGEPGIAGVTLTLTGTNGLGQAITATATTAADGTYSFSTDSSGNVLRPGTYVITETAPAGYLTGAAAVGTVNGVADGTVASATQLSTIALTSGQGGISYNFGDVKAVTLAGLVYQDSNGNNALDAGEPGIAGVTVTLTGTNGLGQAITATATTAANGTYAFTTDSSGNALRPGTYVITETAPSGYLTGAATVGTVNGSADGTVASATQLSTIALTSGQSGINYNFGDLKAVTLAGLVYHDVNANGVQDAGEPGLAGVTVTLTGTNGLGQAITATATTAANGSYSFATDSGGNALRPGTYVITETVPGSYLALIASVGTVNGTNDGTMTSASKISSIGLTSGQAGINYNFSDVKPVTLAGLVYQDTNGNNALNAGEPGIAGVTLTLTGTNGLGQAITATATTAADGSYSFSTDSSGNVLRPGSYTITETAPAGYLTGAATVGTVNGTTDGTAASATQISTIALTSGQAGVSYNFGDLKAVTLAGLVYQDTNGNNALNAGEPGIAGVTLTLTGTNGLGQAITATATTAADGSYSFSTDSSGNVLRPGTYVITETAPAGYLTGAATVGTVNGTADGTLTSATKLSAIALTSGQSGINYNFGDLKAVTLAGLVYQDSNGNNALNAGEPGLAGVTLTLTGTNGLGQAITATATTAADGSYSFTTDSSGNALRPGTYTITETAPAGYLTGAATVGTVSGTTDGTAASVTQISTIALTSGQAGISYNFGDLKAVTLAGLVYQDSNGNNALDAGEPGIAGVTVTLAGTNGLGQAITATATTAANGSYSFTTDSNGNVLRPGTYTITETAPAGYLTGAASVGTVNGTADGTAASATQISTIALTSGQAGISYNFGDLKAVTLAGLVYQDSNGNNALNAGEPGIAGVTLTLSGTNGLGQAITATATTAADGSYSFSTDSSGNVLRPGSYTITETAPAGYLTGAATVGTVNGTTDGTAASATQISTIALTSGQAGISYNFGDVKAVTLAGLVYQDTNGNNALDAGEPGLSGVTVTLSGTNNLGQAISATTTTAANGTYSFSTDSSGNALRPGTYVITETAPTGYLTGAATVGTVNGAADGTLTSATKLSAIALTSGQAGINYNFGDLLPVTLAGLVYQDSNGNNALDSGEPGLSGVTLTLSGTNGLGQAITATTTSAANGTYGFSTDSSGNALRPGTYVITETAPTGYLIGAATVGTVNGTADGTVTSATKLSAIAVTSGQAGVNYNFGDLKAVTLAGLVYQDTNGNGVLDSGEPALASVTLTLSGTNGLGQAITATATTAANGTYSFTTDSSGNVLRPGTYVITETVPSGYLASAASVGTVNGSADGTVASATQLSAIALTSGQAGISYNFGDVKAVTLAGLVYQDTNGNNALDAGEPGLSGVTITLSGTNNLGQSITATTTTAANGTYSFATDSSGNALRPGTYTITETAPAGYLTGAATVGTVNGSADGTAASATQISTIALTSGQAGISYNFGDLKAVTLAGLVYQDSNGNNALNAGEPGLAGVTLTLTGTNGLGQAITATATTAADGSYSFTTDSSSNALRPGTYVITETAPTGYLTGAAAVGTVNGAADGTLTSATKLSAIALTSGQAGINYNFGDLLPVTLAGLVYQDSNGNNALDSGEPGLAGVTLTLSGTNGLGQAITATTTTAANGTYSFTTDSSGNALRPGTYVITETAPAGYLTGAATVGTVNGAADGTAASATQISTIALTSGQTGISYNFGDLKAVTLAGLVYQDTNGNNALDSGEPGLSGVTLTLTGTNGLGQAITATATTAADGSYSFTKDSSGNVLRPGIYVITETAPAGYLTGAATVGTVNGTTDGTVTSATKLSAIALTSGQAGSSYNFGDLKAVTLAGLVYQDTNDNNALNAGEPGLAGVTLTLTGTNGLGQSITATATTAADGSYSFSTDSNGNALRPGTYTITETAPAGYLTGAATVGTVNGAADGTAASATQITTIALTSGQGGSNYNFGDLKAVTLAGLVYQDSNGNNALNAGEPGIAGVTLTLTGTNGLGQAITATATTAADGSYSFSTDSNGNALRPGVYVITETVPSGYLTGAAAVGTVNGSADGSVASATQINAIGLTSGQAGISYNFGDVRPVTLAGLVYQDSNGNNALDAGEPGLSGVTLTLSGTNGLGQSITATTTTAADGSYSFSTDSNGNVLRPGTYAITETAPAGYLTGAATVGTVNGTADGTAASATQISTIALTSGQGGISYNFGDLKAVTLAGLVYQDTNGNNTLDSGEPGLAGVTLTLTGTNGLGQAITATATTAADGSYSFTKDSSGNVLRPGTYVITETAPAGYLTGAATVGTVNGTTDGTVTSATKLSAIALTSGQAGISYNFGDLKAVTLAGLVYQDSNGNNALDSGEPGIGGVTVTLSGTNNLGQSITATTTTAANGTYSFTTDSSGNALRPGSYTITETAPSGYLTGAATVGTVNGTTDGTVASATQLSTIALTSGQAGINYNFGDLKSVTLAGLVYQDTNGNNALDSGEPGLSGVTLTLTGTNGLGQSITATTTTAGNGSYSFTTDSNGNVLRPGTYVITETAPAGYLTGAATVGTVNGTADGTMTSATKISAIALTSGQGGISYNFGDLKAVTLAGLVYLDTNGNNALDSGESGLAGVTLTLTGTNGLGQAITATATTAADGTYSFSTDSNGNALRPGTYVITETLPSGYLAGAASVGTVGGTADGTATSATKISAIALTSGQAGVSYNFGALQPITLSGLVYRDSNDNGVLDPGEPGFAGVSVTLAGTNGLGQSVTAATTTAADGSYRFATDSSGAALRPGTYTITETEPTGYVTGGTNVGTVNGSTDGSVVTFGKIGSIVTTSGQAGINYDFGELKAVTISGTVYQDTNGNGVFDSSEPGLAGVTITLSGTNDKGQSISATATTASDGTYTLGRDSSGNPLRPGTYQVVETQPSGYLAGTTAVGTVNGTADGTASSGTISSIVLGDGQVGINYNFGVVKPVTLAGTVYQDSNGNGALDGGEPGISGVTLTLTGTNGLGQAITATTTTAADGSYSFTTDSNGNVLRPGTYQIAETQPAGYLQGTNTVGTVNGAADGTLVPTDKIGSIALTSGQGGIHYNFGEYQPVTIAGVVYHDLNGSGTLDTGETGFAGVTVTLTGTNGHGTSVSATATTAADGSYSFSTDSNGNVLQPGTYQLTETVPSGYVGVAANVGTVAGSKDGTAATATLINAIALTSGQNGITYDFGLSVPASVSGYVYLDMNSDGVDDNGDAAFTMGALVTLTGTTASGQSVSVTVTTDANGYYIFNGLTTGTYSITLTPPGGVYIPEVSNVGTINSTTVGTATSAVEIDQVHLIVGNTGVNYDFGGTYYSGIGS